MNETVITAGALSAKVTTQGKYGWCGLSDLAHKQHNRRWLLSPALTLEHYIGIPLDSSDYIWYEPCESPKLLHNISPDGCMLQYGALKCSQVECAISYQMVAPHYVDVLVEAETNRVEWPMGSLALFFATIIYAPIYTGVTFLGFDKGVEVKSGNPWVHFNGRASVAGRTVHPAGVDKPELRRPENPPQTYYYDDSSVRFEESFFFGNVENMVFAVFFPRSHRETVRFVVNPLADAFGGPAWDFFWVLNDPPQGVKYSLPLRILFKPFVNTEDIQREYELYATP